MKYTLAILMRHNALEKRLRIPISTGASNYVRPISSLQEHLSAEQQSSLLRD